MNRKRVQKIAPLSDVDGAELIDRSTGNDDAIIEGLVGTNDEPFAGIGALNYRCGAAYYVCMYVCMYMYVYTCMYVFMFVCMAGYRLMQT